MAKLSDRCPWCPNPKGCEGCSLSGEPPGNYILITEGEHRRRLVERLRRQRHRWLMIAASLVGALVALLMLLVAALTFGVR